MFCTNSNTIVVYDASEADRRTLEHVVAGEPGRAYLQYALTWEEALASDREYGGEVWERFGRR
ncbi:hypothetical protein [Actinomadura litoris]|uniref:hypothetical protein n=1 Tax=Actinomadura litoris TaxID=2678616 RepID=UPI001FA6B5EC|nr:hypothetical protein [Actinomadura litoris]